MDVLEPELVWVGNRCYRFCDSNVWSSEQASVPYEEEYNQEADDMSAEIAGNDDITIEERNDGKYIHFFPVPKLQHKFIIGSEGKVRKKLEVDTKTIITVPTIRSTSENVEIIGSNRAAVISCRRRLDLLIESSKKLIPFTHFVSIPLNNEEIMNNFHKFQNHILTTPEMMAEDIVKESFVNPFKLHLTVGMLKLLDSKDKMDAVNALNDCVKEVIEPIINNEPLEIIVEGLEIMNDDQTFINVLYAEVVKNDKLQELANKIFEYFVQRKLMHYQYSNDVKLHMTLMNTRLINKRRNQKDRSHSNKFDGTKILANLKDFYFGKIQLKSIDIAVRETKAANGYYETLTTVELIK